MKTCPLCNKEFKLLCMSHLKRTHSVTLDELKNKDYNSYITYLDSLRILSKTGEKSRKENWESIKVESNCLNCNVKTIISKTAIYNRKFCCYNCAKEYFRKNKIGFYNSETGKKGSISSMKIQKEKGIGFYDKELKRKNNKRLKEAGIGFFSFESRSRGGKIGGRISAEKYGGVYKFRTKEGEEKRIIKLKENWKNREFKEKMLKKFLSSSKNRPTFYEKRIIEVIKKNNLNFKYTGDGSFLIGYKNPDFIDESRKLIIEVYYNYWKIKQFNSIENYEEKRKKIFEKLGYSVRFINDSIMSKENWSDECLKVLE